LFRELSQELAVLKAKKTVLKAEKVELRRRLEISSLMGSTV